MAIFVQINVYFKLLVIRKLTYYNLVRANVKSSGSIANESIYLEAMWSGIECLYLDKTWKHRWSYHCQPLRSLFIAMSPLKL